MCKIIYIVPLKWNQLNPDTLKYFMKVKQYLKPENFMIGTGKKSNKFYTIDFGLSKKYIEQSSHQHIPFRDKKPLIGTARFASINAHKGCELSRRDDLESFAYMLVYLLTGTLPWIGIKAKNKDDKHTKVRQMKINMPEEDICDGCPKQFVTFLKYAKSLDFQEKPNYTYIQNLFQELMDQYNYLDDNVFDWYLLQEQVQQIPPIINDIDYEQYLPFNEDACDDEKEFIKSLNLDSLKNDPDLSPELLGDLIPLCDIKLPEELRTIKPVLQTEFQDQGQNWKQQQQECVRILKEQQFLSNEKEMRGSQYNQFQQSNFNISQQSKNQLPPEEVTFTVREGYNSSNKQQQSQFQQKFGTGNNLQNQLGSNYNNINFNGNIQNSGNNYNKQQISEFQNSNPSVRPGHQKKKSGCQIF
ncbi:Protein kinase-like domain [Pseudocohnilembus persalinus]|uniref:Casein kinase I n=1 Tax=Pseudocohnilembus persalinus TaxID=266149 RepID=A0A0V0R8J8_PSEPJ|nr:Protein kinase-like domain [Pseudocohnilembus persalinus]|eukprot:KRX10820.1 Protein kinase-like domain [Pseudocohnilembus persalinus]